MDGGKDHGAGYGDPATITVYAIAIYDPDDIWEVKVFRAGPTPRSNGWISQDVPLEPGYVMVGGGAEVRYGNEAGTLLYASRPDRDGKNGLWQRRIISGVRLQRFRLTLSG